MSPLRRLILTLSITLCALMMGATAFAESDAAYCLNPLNSNDARCRWGGVPLDNAQLREIGLPGTRGAASPEGTLSAIIAKLIEYAAIIAVGALTITALMLLMSYGDEGKVKQAKLAITYALIGVVITGAAYTIVSVVNQIR